VAWKSDFLVTVYLDRQKLGESYIGEKDKTQFEFHGWRPDFQSSLLLENGCHTCRHSAAVDPSLARLGIHESQLPDHR
jgi:hypothetical protein